MAFTRCESSTIFPFGNGRVSKSGKFTPESHSAQVLESLAAKGPGR